MMTVHQNRAVQEEASWGRIVVIASMLTSIILGAALAMPGLVLDDIVRVMNVSNATASWSISIMLAIISWTAPLAAIGVELFTCRQVAIFGSILMSIGMCISFWSVDIYRLFITMSFIAGVGYGFDRVTSVIVVSQYFHEHYGIAIGFHYIGYSIGRLVFSPVLVLVKESYGIHGTFLITGAFSLNIAVVAYLYRPVTSSRTGSATMMDSVVPDTKEVQSVDPFSQTRHSDNDNSAKKTSSRENLTELNMLDLAEVPQDIDVHQLNRLNSTEPSSQNDHSPTVECHQHVTASETKILMSSSGIYKTSVVSGQSMTRKRRHPTTTRSSSRKKTFTTALDLTLLRETRFLVIMVAILLFYLVIMYSLAFTVPLGLDKGFAPMDTALVQTYKSGAEIIGRVIIPWTLVKTRSNTIHTHIVLSAICGLVIIAQALMTSYLTFAALTMTAGFLLSGLVVQSQHLVLLIFGNRKYPSAIGLSNFLNGFFLLGAGPFFGFVRDRTGSLIEAYLLISAMLLAYAFLWSCLLFCNKTMVKKVPAMTTDN